jgi:predicted nucleotidyltransferase
MSDGEHFGISAASYGILQEIFRRFPSVSRVVIYGSRAKGNYSTGSDIDLTMEGEGLDLTLLLKISEEIDASLIPYKVDLSLRAGISDKDLLAHLARVGKVFYERA